MIDIRKLEFQLDMGEIEINKWDSQLAMISLQFIENEKI